MTVGFDRTADCQGNHPSLTEFLRILTEHYWLCFDRTTSLTEHLGNLGFDRTVNGEMFCQKNVISRVSCHILSLYSGPLSSNLFLSAPEELKLSAKMSKISNNFSGRHSNTCHMTLYIYGLRY